MSKRGQRAGIAQRLAKMPSLRPLLDDDWIIEAFEDAVQLASEQTGIDVFPDTCPWSIQQILAPDFLPS